MYRPFSLCFGALLLAAALFLTGCDSGFAPGTQVDTSDPTVTFSTDETIRSERDTTVSVTVTVESSPSSDVSVELLFAAGASTADTSDFDFGDVTPVGAAFRVATLTFPAGAEGDAASQTLTYNVVDDTTETEDELAVFALQNASGANIGNNPAFRLTLSGEGTIEVFFEDFDANGPSLGEMQAIDVASSANWESASFSGADNSPYAQANAFGSDEPADDWLVSPRLDLSEFNGANVSFISAVGFSDDGLDEPAISLLVSTDYDGESTSPGDFTWQEVGDASIFAAQSDRDGNFSPFIESGDVDISDVAGESNVYIAFRYISSGTGGGSTEARQVDNIRVNGLQ